jgi:hypothetical protein
MAIYGIIGIVVLLFGVFSLLTYQRATKDFSLREFSSLKEKNKWRRLIYFVPFGTLWYLIKVKDKFKLKT